MRKPFWGRTKHSEKQARHDALVRAYGALELLDNEAFHDAFQCEIDIIVDDMLNIEPDTPDKEAMLLRLHARARELNNLISRLRSFANQRKVIEIQAEKEADFQ